MINMNYIQLVSLYLRENAEREGIYIIGSVKEYLIVVVIKYCIDMVQNQSHY